MYTSSGDNMKYIIITDEYEDTLNLQNLFSCKMYNYGSDIDYSDADFIILTYRINKGRCNSYVYDTCASISGKNVAIIGIGTFGFDINRLLLRRLKKRNNLVVYSRYVSKRCDQEIYDEVTNRKVRTDGMEHSEILTGSLCRLFFKKGF